MSDPTAPRPVAVPGSRLSRLARFGGLASGVAGGMALNGARQAVRGQRPRMADLLLTPANAARVAEQLAQMRGAAMKVGQLLSMDAGEVLPPELAEILARLRNEAHFMPPRQLRTVLDAAWGADWRRRFARFDVRPMAAASIGQVHRAQSADGRDLAIKVQYPGVRRSIDSDVSNVAALIRLSGLVPKGIDLTPLLEEARRQLHEEADYEREGAALALFGDLLEGTEDFTVPTLHRDLTTGDVLAMSFAPGTPVEDMAAAGQDVRDRIARLLIALMLRELFEFGLMQTDPNFANYRYDAATGRLVLLDFGATRDFAPELAEGFRRLLRAGLGGDADEIHAAMLATGLIAPEMPPAHQTAYRQMFAMAMAPFRQAGPFDFATSDLAIRLRDAGLEMGLRSDIAHVPPADVLFLQRKVGGLYLLARRLRARVALRDLVDPYL